MIFIVNYPGAMDHNVPTVINCGIFFFVFGLTQI